MLNKDLGLLSTYRGELMGLAILLILTYHAFLYTSAPDIVKAVTQTGRIGVDFFLILSAIGLYFSLMKNSSLIFFFKKRMNRIIPTYVLLAAPYFIYTSFTQHTGVLGFLSDITFYTSLKGGNNPYYFIELIVICYMLMPLLFWLSQYKYVWLVFTTLFCCICYSYGYIAEGNEIVINRIPIFAIGVVIAKFVYHKTVVPNVLIVSLLILCFIFVGSYFMPSLGVVGVRIKYSLISIPLLMIIVYILDAFQLSSIKRALKFCGNITLEIYMINFPVIAVLTRIFDNIYIIALLTFIFSIAFSYIAHQAIAKFVNRK